MPSVDLSKVDFEDVIAKCCFHAEDVNDFYGYSPQCISKYIADHKLDPWRDYMSAIMETLIELGYSCIPTYGI